MDDVGTMLMPIGETALGRDALANIVFVHGIGSSGKTAWSAAQSGKKSFPDWLSEDLEDYTEAPVNVWLANYPAEVFRFLFLSPWREDSVTQRGRMLLDQTAAQELARRPVVFITHSLGGTNRCFGVLQMLATFQPKVLQAAMSSTWPSARD